MNNFSSLLHSTTEHPTLLSQLNLSETDLAVIASARSEIRSHLRDGLPEELRRIGHGESAVAPRFFTQGSYAYKTLNSPAQPPQQADIDDGVYLPLGFVASSGAPSSAADIFFTAVEAVLTPLTTANGWHLITNKPTCIRVELNTRIHADLPLYAIPDSEFTTLERKTAYRPDGRFKDSDTDIWKQLPQDQVLLAHRTKNWVKSDPRPLKNWFLDEVNTLGEQYRRVVRYLKALRDWHWAAGGPSSILLMVAASKVFEVREDRDDLALVQVLKALPSVLRLGFDNPVDPKESLSGRLKPSELEEVASYFETIGATAEYVFHQTPQQLCQTMNTLFGERFPNEPARVKQVTTESTPTTVVRTPLVGRTQAG